MRLFLLGFFLLIANWLPAQLIFDFSQMEFTNPITPIENDTPITFKVTNINTFLYKVTVEGKQVDFNTTIASPLQKIFSVEAMTSEETSEKAKEGVEETNKALIIMKEVVKKDTNLHSIITPLIDSCGVYIDEMKEIVELMDKLQFQRTLLIAYSKQNWTFPKMQIEVNKLNIPLWDSVLTVMAKFEQSYEDIEIFYEQKEEELKDSLRAKFAIKEAVINIENGYHKFKEEQLFPTLKEVMILKTELLNPKNFEVAIPPIQMIGDQVSFEMNITLTETNQFAPYRHTFPMNIDIPGKGGWKTDFSVGPVLSFLGAINDEKPFLKDTAIDSIGQLEVEYPRNNIRPNVAAMMHFYKRRGKGVNFGGLFGVGTGFTTLDDANLSFFLGGSFVLGKRKKVMINSGLSLLKVDRLKSPFDTGQEIERTKINLEEITESVFRPSAFFGISYSLTQKIEQN